MAFSILQHRRSSLLQSGNSGIASIQGGWPTNTASGNLLVAALIFKGNGTVTNSIAGWTQITTVQNTTLQVEAWYKQNSSGTDESPTFTIPASVKYLAHIAEFSGAATAGVVDISASITASGQASLVAAVTNTTNASQLIYAVGGVGTTGGLSGTAANWSSPSSVVGGATFEADIDFTNAVKGSVGGIHTWALSGAANTNPGIQFVVSGSGGTGQNVGGVVVAFNPPLTSVVSAVIGIQEFMLLGIGT